MVVNVHLSGLDISCFIL